MSAHFVFFASIDVLSGFPSSMASTIELYEGLSPILPFEMKIPNTESPTKPKMKVNINQKPKD